MKINICGMSYLRSHAQHRAVAGIDEFAARKKHLELILVLLLEAEKIVNAAFLKLGIENQLFCSRNTNFLDSVS